MRHTVQNFLLENERYCIFSSLPLTLHFNLELFSDFFFLNKSMPTTRPNNCLSIQCNILLFHSLLKNYINLCLQQKCNTALGLTKSCLGDYGTIVLIREINYWTIITIRFSTLKGDSIKNLNAWEYYFMICRTEAYSYQCWLYCFP